jgi:hypothetical protein
MHSSLCKNNVVYERQNLRSGEENKKGNIE